MRRWMLLVALLVGALDAKLAFTAGRPNILWLSSEDHGPQMGCYGDTFATTPNIDALAAKGMIYTRCWSNAPVCAPARTTIISGLYPPSTGAEHMRSMVAFPAGKQMFPQYLREAGYYCTNNSKEDYNLEKPGQVWDVSSGNAHWRTRGKGQPFFAVFNSTKSHESQVRKRPHEAIHDPAKVRVPAYHPDTPEVRQDWAQYYDGVTAVDADAGQRLRELEEAGLVDDTIVFYFADHGPGMPGNKRWPRDAGLRVPLVVYIPDKFADLRPPDYKVGGRSERLVSFVDFAPTVLSLAGIRPHDWMQGSAFLGKFQTEPRKFIYGFRGRMDERYDLIRCVSDGRHVYIRNYRPDLPYGQHLDYMWQTPTTQVWERMFHEGKLDAAQSYFWKTKPPEELYDLKEDPDETRNLAGESEQEPTRTILRLALDEHEERIRDLGFLPEGEIHRRSAGTTPYDMGHNSEEYPFVRIRGLADIASNLKPDALPILKLSLSEEDPASRYWAVLGHSMRGESAVMGSHDEIVKLLDDPSPDVQIAAAAALGRYGTPADLERVLPLLIGLADSKQHDVFTVMAALNAIDSLGEKAAPLRPQLAKLPKKGPVPNGRYGGYPARLLEWLNR